MPKALDHEQAKADGGDLTRIGVQEGARVKPAERKNQRGDQAGNNSEG